MANRLADAHTTQDLNRLSAQFEIQSTGFADLCRENSLSIQRHLRRCAIACHCRGSWRTTPNERTTGAKRPSRVSQRQQTHSRCTATQAQSCRDRCAIRREARDSRLIGCGDPVQERLCPYSVKVEVKLATFDLAAANPIGSPMLTSTDHKSAAATCVPLPTR